MTDDNKQDLHEQVERTHGYHRPKYQETMTDMGKLRAEYRSTGHKIVDLCPRSREMSLALTYLDLSNMLAIAALARFEPPGTEPNSTSHPPEVTQSFTADLLDMIYRFEHGTLYDDYDEATALLGRLKQGLGDASPPKLPTDPPTRPDPIYDDRDAFAPQAEQDPMRERFPTE